MLRNKQTFHLDSLLLYFLKSSPCLVPPVKQHILILMLLGARYFCCVTVVTGDIWKPNPSIQVKWTLICSVGMILSHYSREHQGESKSGLKTASFSSCEWVSAGGATTSGECTFYLTFLFRAITSKLPNPVLISACGCRCLRTCVCAHVLYAWLQWESSQSPFD